MEVAVREAVVDDAAVLREYAARLFSERLPGIFRRLFPTLEEEREFVAAYAVPANSVLLIAEVDGQAVGLAGLRGRTLERRRTWPLPALGRPHLLLLSRWPFMSRF